MSHTPGPWKLNFSNAEPAVTDYDNVMIAIVTTDEDKPQETEEVLANGRLIAAAPELLAAIKGLLDAGEYDDAGDFVIRCTKEKSDGDYPDYIEATSIRAANLAIAKAEGRGE
jgi:hypothetical protein